MWHVWKTGKVQTEFWWGDLMEGTPSEGLRIILKFIFTQCNGKA
jgi:hypothetical protein